MADATRNYVFPPAPQPAVPFVGEDLLYPVSRIFCVGRNYAEHAREMGVEPERDAPWYFTKAANALVLSGATIPYPPSTSNYHYEMELVVALGAPAYFVSPEAALDAVLGYSTGLDMTRRDLQMEARSKSRPWDLGKAFEQSAVIAPLTRKEALGEIRNQAIELTVNGTTKQKATLADLIWSVPEIIAHLSRFYHLGPGDLIYTGTPAGVGPVVPGDRIEGSITGLSPVVITIGPGDQA